MPMTLSLDETQGIARDMILAIARSGSPYTVLDGDNPVVQIVPMPAHRRITSDSRLSGSISKEDLFSDDSALWEAVEA